MGWIINVAFPHFCSHSSLSLGDPDSSGEAPGEAQLRDDVQPLPYAGHWALLRPPPDGERYRSQRCHLTSRLQGQAPRKSHGEHVVSSCRIARSSDCWQWQPRSIDEKNSFWWNLLDESKIILVHLLTPFSIDVNNGRNVLFYLIYRLYVSEKKAAGCMQLDLPAEGGGLSQQASS